MFNLFKPKKKEEPQHQLSEQIPVSNLEAYVVQGYENEKRLKSEIADLKNEIESFKKKEKEHDALKVVLRNKEREISGLLVENKRIERLEERLSESEKRFNSSKIREQSLLDERGRLEKEMRGVVTAEVKGRISYKVSNHKGNLSKAAVLEMIEGVQ